MTMETWQLTSYGVQQSNAKMKVYGYTRLAWQRREISNKQPKLTPKATRKRTPQILKLVEGKKS